MNASVTMQSPLGPTAAGFALGAIQSHEEDAANRVTLTRINSYPPVYQVVGFKRGHHFLKTFRSLPQARLFFVTKAGELALAAGVAK